MLLPPPQQACPEEKEAARARIDAMKENPAVKKGPNMVQNTAAARSWRGMPMPLSAAFNCALIEVGMFGDGV